MSHCVEVMNNRKSLVVGNDQFGMKTKGDNISKTVARYSNLPELTVPLKNEEQELLAFGNVINEELKQLLSYISNKRQLKGVEVSFLKCYQLVQMFKSH